MSKIGHYLSGTFNVIFIIAYIGSLPLAIIFGGKWDVVISLFIPTYGFWITLASFL